MGWSPKYGGFFDIMAHARAAEDDNYKSERQLAYKQSALRMEIADRLANIARERRARFMDMYAPTIKKMAEDAAAGINPNTDEIRSGAQGSVEKAFGQEGQSRERELGRYGIQPTKEMQRETNLAETAGKVYAGNSAVYDALDRAEQLNQTRGIQALSLGMGIPTQASAGIFSAGSGLANGMNSQLYDLMMKGGDINAGVSGAGQVAGGVSQLFADGGLVSMGGRPGSTINLRKKYTDYQIGEAEVGRTPKAWPEWLEDNGYHLGGDNLVQPKPSTPGGIMQKDYADGGLVSMGGRPGMTIDLRNKYNFYRISEAEQGNTPKDWPEWLEDQGYRLHNDNLVQPKPAAPQGASRNGYADGGRVIDGESERVDLENNDFIIPEFAVEYYGKDFFDKLVAQEEQ